jgi:hypothetical protein
MGYTNMYQQVKFIKDNGKMIYGMEKDNINLLIIKFILKEHGKMDYFMVKMYNLLIKMDSILKDNIKIIKKMELVLLNIQMVHFFKVCLKMILQMDMVNL